MQIYYIHVHILCLRAQIINKSPPRQPSWLINGAPAHINNFKSAAKETDDASLFYHADIYVHFLFLSAPQTRPKLCCSPCLHH